MPIGQTAKIGIRLDRPNGLSKSVIPRDPVNEDVDARFRSHAWKACFLAQGYRLCEHAHAMGKPIAATHRGRTRADHLFALKVEDGCGEVLTDLVETLSVIPSLV